MLLDLLAFGEDPYNDPINLDISQPPHFVLIASKHGTIRTQDLLCSSNAVVQMSHRLILVFIGKREQARKITDPN